MISRKWRKTITRVIVIPIVIVFVALYTLFKTMWFESGNLSFENMFSKWNIVETFMIFGLVLLLYMRNNK